MTSLLKRVTVGALILMAVFAVPAAAQGYFFRIDQVQANATDTWRVETSGGRFHVTVRGDGDTDLDVFVYDAVTGRLLGSDEDDTDYCVVRGYSDSGRLRIRIKNWGSVYNEYQITVR